jgi:hypothetical protein
VLFVICIYVLIYRKGKNVPLNRPMIIATVALFTMSSVHVVVDFVRGLQAFFNPQAGSAIAYYAQIWDGLSIFKQALYATNK